MRNTNIEIPYFIIYQLIEFLYVNGRIHGFADGEKHGLY